MRGLEDGGVVATLKHFLGYSASRAARNLAPVSIGPRELADVILPPFEMALRAGARSVMNSYTDIDGVPAAADPALLTTLLREQLGFTGTVVADYFSVAFLQTLHRVADSLGEAAGLALEAGIDVELPSTNAFGAPLLDAIAAGLVDEKIVDRALSRVLRQKCELGLLDPAGRRPRSREVDLDDPESRALALELARRSVVLLANDGSLPLAAGAPVAVVGPRADTSEAMLGCYSFPMHVLVHHPGVEDGVEIRTVREALADTYDVTYALGCPVLGGEDADIEAAVAVAADAEVCVVVLGDQAGLFGNGTSGEGCDVADLNLPGRQEELLEALLATGTPVVAVLLVGRPYDLSRQVDRLAGLVCGFFPGEEGAQAIADVLSGRVNPSGRLPGQLPGRGVDPALDVPRLPAGAAQRGERRRPDAALRLRARAVVRRRHLGRGVQRRRARGGRPTAPASSWCELANEADRDVSEVVQVYLHDRSASVVRPVQQLVGAARVDLAPGSGRRSGSRCRADLTSFTGRDLVRIVEPGEVELWVGASSTDIREVLAARAGRPDPGGGCRAGAGADRHRRRLD